MGTGSAGRGVYRLPPPGRYWAHARSRRPSRGPAVLVACFSNSSGGPNGATFDAAVDGAEFDSSMPDSESPVEASLEGGADSTTSPAEAGQTEEAGPVESGTFDSGFFDSGFPDSGLVDAAVSDAQLDAVVDAGPLPVVVVVAGVNGYEPGVPVVFSTPGWKRARQRDDGRHRPGVLSAARGRCGHDYPRDDHRTAAHELHRGLARSADPDGRPHHPPALDAAGRRRPASRPGRRFGLLLRGARRHLCLARDQPGAHRPEPPGVTGVHRLCPGGQHLHRRVPDARRRARQRDPPPGLPVQPRQQPARDRRSR